jgi:hypothetical protein
MRLRDILFCQPDFIADNLGNFKPWLKPPFEAPTVPLGTGAPPHQRLPNEVADLL